MATVSATEARKRLYALIDEVGASHEPVQITGKRGNAVLLSEEDCLSPAKWWKFPGPQPRRSRG